MLEFHGEIYIWWALVERSVGRLLWETESHVNFGFHFVVVAHCFIRDSVF